MSAYYMLVASLPKLPSRYDAGPLPITPRQLSKRLSILDDDDRRVTDALADFFRWDRLPIDCTDQQVFEKFDQLYESLRNPLVRVIVKHRFEMRRLVAGVRRGVEVPLDSRYPWLGPFAAAFQQDRPMEAQAVLFDELWNFWTRLSQRFHFTLESVVLYLARWELCRRWSTQDPRVGRQRFDNFVDNLIGQPNHA